MRRVYHDCNATLPPRPAALEAARRVMTESWGNPASPHGEGRRAREILEGARREVAALVGVGPGDVVFTSGGTEAARLALAGVVHGASEGVRRGRVVISGIEHAAVAGAAADLGAEGYEIVVVPPDADGVIEATRFLEACPGGATLAAALIVAQNEIGTLQPVAEIAAALTERGVPLIADAVQAIGRRPRGARVAERLVLLLSAHKLGGLAGAGAFVLPRDVPFAAPSGGSQEQGRRPGTPGLALVAALGAAARAGPDTDAEIGRQEKLRDQLETGLLGRCAASRIVGRGRDRLPNTTAAVFGGLRGEDLVAALDLEGVAVSTGSACVSGAARPSAVLLALGYDRDTARALVRFSLGPATEVGEIETAVAATEAAVARLRRAQAGAA